MASLALIPHPLRFVRGRFRQWWQSRLPLTDNVTLTQRNVYILPTRAGLMLAATLLLLLVASINYQLNLGYLLTFMLAGSAMVGMHVSHRTLRGMAMHLTAPAAQFAGAAAMLDVRLTNERRRARHGIGLALLDPPEAVTGKASKRKPEQHWAWTDVPALNTSVVQVAWQPARRGLHRLPTLTAETRFPLGTFRVWTVWRPAAEILVYPAPEPQPPPLPPAEPRPGNASVASRAAESGEFDGVRAYRRGDPLKLVVWKKATHTDEQGGGLVVRDSLQSQQHELWLDFLQAGAGTEARLSRLCAWVLAADRLDLTYGLRLPSQVIKPSTGEAHKRQCMEALALC
ncbi:MAG: DUF58 domain-containing protein [Polaromonas sp.]|nr:DUF58 domain-containing protein [Polaromonas sp.]